MKRLLILAVWLISANAFALNEHPTKVDATTASAGEYFSATGFIADDTPTASCTDGKWCAARGSSNGALYCSVATSALPTGASTFAEQQTQTTALQLIDDAVYTAGSGTPSKGVLMLGSDGTNPRAAVVDANGRVHTDPHDIIEIQATVDVSEAAYASGDAIGTAHTFANAARAGYLTTRIKAVTVSDIDAQAVNLDLVCYTINATDPTDNAAYDPVDAEVDNAKVIHITDHTTFNDNTLSQATGLDIVMGPLASTSIECHLVARGAPDYAAADDLIITLTVDRG